MNKVIYYILFFTVCCCQMGAQADEEIACGEGNLVTSSLLDRYIQLACFIETERNIVVQHGPYLLKDNSGHVLIRSNYNQGELDGQYTEYYVSGGKSLEGMYDMGVKVGCWKEWNEEGRLTDSTEYSIPKQ